MRNILVIFYIFITFGLANSSVNAALGLPENTARIGYSLGVSHIAVDDPIGSTKSAYSIQPIKLIYSDWWKGASRYWVELYYQEMNLAANQVQVGQHIKHAGMNFFLQKNVPINSLIRPWFGVGLSISADVYQKRHTKDDEDFLLKSFPDRDSKTVGVLLNVVNEWQVSRESTIGGSFLQRLPLGIPYESDLTESVLSVYFLTRY